ncbi:MAG: hypothetical protein QF593_06210, partial [Nitrospinota bacterium]|nr:hypothetical protein [Nitrospinota bacterium]
RIEVRVTEDARPGTVRVYSGGSPELGAANLLTPDRVTGYSESAAFNDCRVELAKAEPPACRFAYARVGRRGDLSQ